MRLTVIDSRNCLRFRSQSLRDAVGAVRGSARQLVPAVAHHLAVAEEADPRQGALRRSRVDLDADVVPGAVAEVLRHLRLRRAKEPHTGDRGMTSGSREALHIC